MSSRFKSRSPLPESAQGLNDPEKVPSLLEGLSIRHRFVLLWCGMFVGISTLLRIALLLRSAVRVTWDSSLLASLLFGFLFDLGAAVLVATPWLLLLSFLPARLLRSGVGHGLIHFLFFINICLVLLLAVAEWFFWEEFGVRFNFIAVDYLVYTTEVLANIRESYPLPLISAGIALIAFGLHQLVFRPLLQLHRINDGRDLRLGRLAAILLISVLLAYVTVLDSSWLPPFANNYNRELGKNGVWALFAAFRNNELSYEEFYPVTDDGQAFSRTRAILARDGATPLAQDGYDLARRIERSGTERRWNVIQITVESLSAEFLGAFGNQDNLTPELDAIASRSLLFKKFYATGNRTDRGMEALTLSVPPTPGRSLVKRPQNSGLFTLGSVFRAKGYDTAFLYGGYGYFDNMNAFFGGNGYRIVDRAAVPKSDISFANAWGACDEDLYRWSLREADEQYARGKPFYQFVMTTSNHRPFTFPEGRIDLPSKKAGRAGGVKYTDYAIGKFMREAERRPWFTNTLIVVVGDHCASSAGRTTLPIENYLVPLIFYAPGRLDPAEIGSLSSQIDFAPTLLGILNWSYVTRFYGWDVLRNSALTNGANYALLGTYQKLGCLREDGAFAVLHPVRKSASYLYNNASHQLVLTNNPAIISDAISFYQTASYLFRHGLQIEVPNTR